MKILNKSCFNKVFESIMKYGRPLEQNILIHHFDGSSSDKVINELKRFQNEDGGFAHGIESDFRMPHSSPMATSVGIRILSETGETKESREMIEKGIQYLEKSFDKKRNGWFSVTKEVNEYPHTPWWKYDENEGMTIIDKNWGNPSAEILAYLYKYKEYVKNLDVYSIVEYAIKYIEDKKEFTSENEIYCYIKLYEVLGDEFKNRLNKVISSAIAQVIIYDEKKWHEYVPTPVDFICKTSSHRFNILESKIQDNLDFIINQLENNKKIVPPWGDSFYKGDLKEAYDEWVGVWTLKALITLNQFNRIEK